MAPESHDLAAMGCGRNPGNKIIDAFAAIDTLHPCNLIKNVDPASKPYYRIGLLARFRAAEAIDDERIGVVSCHSRLKRRW
jgi:hypothetical protein